MTFFQFLAVSLFVLSCIFITYGNQKKQIALMKQRDRLMSSLDILIRRIKDNYPEAIHEEDEDVVAAKKLLVSIIRPAITKK